MNRWDGQGQEDIDGQERGGGGDKVGKQDSFSTTSRSPSRSRSEYLSVSDCSSQSLLGSWSDRSVSSSRSLSRGSCRSYSRSASRSYSRSPLPESVKRKRSSGGSRSSCGSGRSGRDDEIEEETLAQKAMEEEATKDQRTLFVSQLVMRADERDIGRYFRRKIGIEVRDVILLQDKRTGRHKGCAYVEEVGRLEDIDRALGATGKTPDFQRFPILVKCNGGRVTVIHPPSLRYCFWRRFRQQLWTALPTYGRRDAHQVTEGVHRIDRPMRHPRAIADTVLAVWHTRKGTSADGHPNGLVARLCILELPGPEGCQPRNSDYERTDACWEVTVSIFHVFLFE